MGRLLWLPLIVFLLIGPQAVQAADECVACHTDAAKLQAMVQPPAESAEEEGSS